MKNILFLIIVSVFLSNSLAKAESIVVSDNSDRTVMCNISDGIVFNYEIIAKKDNIKYKIITQTDICVILQCNAGQFSWFETIARIATKLLPKTVLGICLLTAKCPAICDVVYAVTEAVVNIFDKETQTGITNGLEWVAQKFSGNSSATVKTNTLMEANDIHESFAEYRKLPLRYLIYAGSYHEQYKAESQVQKVKNFGYNSVYIKKVTVKNQIWYRVVIDDNFRTKTEASDVKKRLITNNIINDPWSQVADKIRWGIIEVKKT